MIGSAVGTVAAVVTLVATVGGGSLANPSWLYLRYLGLVLGLGPGTRTRGVVAFAVLAVAFAVAFALVASRVIGDVAGGLMWLARTNKVTRFLFGPFFRRVPVTTTASVMGLVYGLALGVVVGRSIVPALVVGATRFSFELSASDPGIVYGFAAYGLALGVGYGLSLDDVVRRPSVPGVLPTGVRAYLSATAVSGAAAAVLLYVLAPGHLASLALLANVTPTVTNALGIWLFVTLLLSAGFVLTVARTVSRGEGYVSGMLGAGFAYGVVLAVGLGMLAVPHFATQFTEWTIDVPVTNVGPILAYLMYGALLGVTYASVQRTGSLTPEVVRGRRVEVALVTFLAGGVGGAVIYLPGFGEMLYYGALIGSPGSVPRSWAVWLTIAFLLGAIFVRFVRPRDESEAYLWRSARRGGYFGVAAGLIVGGILVPSLVTAASSYNLGSLHLAPKVLAGYTVFGAIVGLGWGAIVEEEGMAAGSDPTKAVLFGGLFGGLVGGLSLHHLYGPVYIQMLGSLVGVEGSIAKSWAVWLILAVVFGIGFARVVTPSIDVYVDRVTRRTADHPDLRMVLQPMLERAPLTTTAAGMGLAYGAALGVVVGLLVVPLVVNLFTPFNFGTTVLLSLPVVFSYTLYGGVLGAGYGVMMEF